MPFIKVVKSKAYYKRFQTKFRRRREGKTDYYARKRLIMQDKNKYASPKYRFIVRFSNRNITCQFAYSKLCGDVIMAAAYSHELPRYGVKVGLTNYSAAYCVGLLCARRVLTKLGLAESYVGVTEADGKMFTVEEEGERRPFKAFLDVGLSRTSTGSKIFAALKGAADGGVLIPHSEKRLVGYDTEEKALDSEMLRKYIYGGHIGDYMNYLQEEDPQKYQRQFSKYLKEGITADNMEEVYKKAHSGIRADPSVKKAPKKELKEKKRFTPKRLTLAQRKERIAKKKELLGMTV